MINVTADMRPTMEALGIIDGIASAVETDIYVNYVVDNAANELKEKFENDFLAAALSNPRAFHHVFEWGSIGYHGILQDSPVDIPTPLYALTKRGRGRVKEIGFRFKQSKIYVPLPDAERAGIPQENIDRLKRRHVFRFKAYVMESGMSVHVRPRGAKALFVPTPNAENGFAFSKGLTVQPGKGNAGRFTGFWETWWSSVAPNYMEERVLPEVENRIKVIAESALRNVRRGSRVAPKQFKVQTRSALEAMAESKARMVENQMIRDAKSMEYDDEEWDEEE